MSRAADVIEREMEAAGIAALELSLADLAGAAARDAPIDEGTLRGAATWWIELLPGGGAVGTVAFPLVYAAVQEKEESFAHPRGGKAHYLGDALKSRAPRYRMALDRAVRKVERGR